MTERTRVLVTGADGFIGRNLCARLGEAARLDVARITRKDGLAAALDRADFVFHLAGASRPRDAADFRTDNEDYTRSLCGLAAGTGRAIPIVFASSTQAALDNPYGASKRAAEAILSEYGRRTGAFVRLLRLANVFGKWAEPNHNSAIATFCHNMARNLPVDVRDRSAPLRLAYIDDVVSTLVGFLEPRPDARQREVEPVYDTTVGEVVDILREFADGRGALATPRAGAGLRRALYATYLSHLDPSGFAYRIPRHGDARGEFVEMLKTEDSGQISYFTMRPGAARGGHYHHTKTEKFLVVRGTARFGFRNVATGRTAEILVCGGEGQIVDAVPGWAHTVTNVGDDEVICMLWASEVFDPGRPDTSAAPT